MSNVRRMKTPLALVDWLTDKVERQHWAGVQRSRAVTHTWQRHMGGRIMSATLSASIAPAPEFSLSVAADGVASEYGSAARNAAVTVLLAQSWLPVLCCEIKLYSFQADERESSYAAFYAASKEATEQLLGVAPGFSPNIAWGHGGA